MKLCVPFIGDEELAEIAGVLRSGTLTQGPKIAEFERAVAGFLGCRHAFAMSSCTTALHLSLVALGVGPGDEVLVADFTFPATANVVVQQGAVPVLVDIDLAMLTMDPADLRAKFSDRTRAVIPVHAFGCPPDLDAIIEVASERDVPVLEDAATAIGSTYRGRPCGTVGALGCFSFHPRKTITTGEGGMIVTDDDMLADRIRLLRSHGGAPDGDRPWYRYEQAGFNYRLSDVQGAIGVAQMRKLPDIIKRRRTLAVGLSERLAGVGRLTLPCDPPWGTHAYQSYVAVLDEGLDRDRLVANLRARDVEATLGTYAVHDQPYYQQRFGYRPGQLPNSHAAFARTLTLPLYPGMTDADLDTITAELTDVISTQ